MRQLRSSIGRSRDSDLSAIHTWLTEEQRRGVHGNFLCNWALTEKAHAERRLVVYFSSEENIPIAYQWGALASPGILQVKYEHRGKGVGTKLVRHLIQRARRRNEDILWIECTPSSSISFWKSMGFTICDNGVNAFQILPRTLEVPSIGVEVSLEIRFYPEWRKWKPDTRPLESFKLIGFETEGHMVLLTERIHFCPFQYPEIRDSVVEIIRNGTLVYLDKLKYHQTDSMGAKRCRNGWYFDHIEYERE